MTQLERLNFLLKALLAEQPEYADIKIPRGTEEKKHLLRTLLNIRMPRKASAEFLRVQDAYLQEEIAEKGITDGNALPFLQDRICLWQGDITTLRCGAIVNAANSRLLGCFVPCHGCIDNAIHTYAGVQLRLECAQIMRGGVAETGTAILTSAYNLPCGSILHTVGPVIHGVLTETDCAQLTRCYRACLEAAERHHIKSVSFCCISTGEFHFPNEKAAEIAVGAVKAHLLKSDMERVIFNVFKDEDRRIYQRLLTAD